MFNDYFEEKPVGFDSIPTQKKNLGIEILPILNLEKVWLNRRQPTTTDSNEDND